MRKSRNLSTNWLYMTDLSVHVASDGPYLPFYPLPPEGDTPFYQSVIQEAMSSVGLPGGKVREPMQNITAEEKEELKGFSKCSGPLSRYSIHDKRHGKGVQLLYQIGT